MSNNSGYTFSEYVKRPEATLTVTSTGELQTIDCTDYSTIIVQPYTAGVEGIPVIYDLDNTVTLTVKSVSNWESYTETSTPYMQLYNYKCTIKVNNNNLIELIGLKIYINNVLFDGYVEASTTSSEQDIYLYLNSSTAPESFNKDQVKVIVYKIYDTLESYVTNIEGYIEGNTLVSDSFNIYPKDIVIASKLITPILYDSTTSKLYDEINIENYKYVNVPRIKKGSVSHSLNKSITKPNATISYSNTITPGYIDSLPDIDPITIAASELVEGTVESDYTLAEAMGNGKDVTNYQYVKIPNAVLTVTSDPTQATEKIGGAEIVLYAGNYYKWEE